MSENNEKETVEAKLRNLLSPVLNLVKAVSSSSGDSENIKNLCESVNLNIERIIEIGDIVDSNLTDDFDINKEIDIRLVKHNKLDRLETLIQCCGEDGWYSPGTYGLDLVAVENTRQIIEAADSDVLEQFNLFPSPNGSLTLEAKERFICAMSIGNDGCSYAACKKDVEYADEINERSNMTGYIKPFDAQKSADVLREIIEFVKE